MNYGAVIDTDDAFEAISDGMVDIMEYLREHFTDPDTPIGNLAFTHGSARFKLNAGPNMWRSHCLKLIVGILDWGHEYEFIQADMVFVQRRGSTRRTLGSGSLLLNQLENTVTS